MKSLLLKIFTWWNGQTLNTQVWTWLYGELVGTDEDPQDRTGVAAALAAAGAVVVPSAAAALRYAVAALSPDTSSPPGPVGLDALAAPCAAVSVGLSSFADSLAAQGAPVVAVDWRPPAGGDDRLASILGRMKRGRSAS